ncbi:hypothetical protein ABDK09_12415 [Vibrio sp. CDRSL-10 TSBA]
MNSKLTITANLLAATLLTGCGGGGGGGSSSSSSVSYFKVDFIKLYAMDYDTTSSCQIFGYDDANEPTKKVVGYAATSDSDEYSVSVVIHNADGSIVSTATSSDWGASGTSYRFRQSSVPSDGYVSFIRKFSDNQDSYQVTTFAKDLLPSSFDLAVRRTTSAGSSCVKSNTTTSKEVTSYITNESTTSQYYYGFNTYNQDLSDLTSDYAELGTNTGGITFTTLNGKKVMAVRYGNNSDTIGRLQAYKILSLSAADSYDFNNPIVLDDVTYNDLSWTEPSVDSLTAANMFIYQQGTGALLWQPLSDGNGDYSYSADINDDNYFINMAGTNGNWTFEHTELMETPSVGQDSSSSISSVDLPAAQSLSIDSCSSAELGTCLVTNDDSSERSDTLQRLLVTVSSSDVSATQVIYSAYKATVPVMTFNDTIDNLWSGATASTYEISLLQSDESELQEAFTFGHLNAYPLTDSTFNEVDFADRLPLLSSVQQQEEYQDTLKYLPHTWLKAVY